MTLDATQQLACIAEAARAPSAHNTQPARWRFTGESGVTLLEDPMRQLRIGDPTGRDQRIGLGAAFEGMKLALSRRGLRLGEPSLRSCTGAADAGLREVATAQIQGSVAADPLVDLVEERHCFRGSFDPASPDQARGLRSWARRSPGVLFLNSPNDLFEIARLHEVSTLELLSDPAYQRELIGWMRLVRRDPGWSRDGLSVDCLGLSAIERQLARLAFRPAILRLLLRLGLASMVVSERAQILSATAVLILCGKEHEAPFDAGRRFYRQWLELAGLGFSACPLSAINDTPRGNAYVKRRWPVPERASIVNLLRVGPARPDSRVTSRRLPAHELRVE